MRRNDPWDERFVYVAVFDRPLPYCTDATITFANSNMRMAKDHAEYCAWHHNAKVLSVRRATEEETLAFHTEVAK